MASTGNDPETGAAFSPLEVRSSRGTGVIMLTQQGDFVFKPHPRRSGFVSWLCGLLRPLKPQHIPADRLLGASRESPCAFTVWYSLEYTTRLGGLTKHHFRARKTLRFDTRDTTAVAALVEHLRRTSSWWGRAQPPHIAAIINPVSGRRTAPRMFESRVLHLLRDVAGLRVTVHTTQARMHAAELVRNMALRPTAAPQQPLRTAAAPAAAAAGGGDDRDDAEGVDMIVFVGGDGTFYEGLQGLFQRPDWDTARHVPLAAVPCGSGNGLAASAGLWDPVTAAVAVCRGRREPLDVASVLQPPGNRFYCVLSVVYGSMANLDIGTNHLRWMGELRFHLGGLWELIKGRCYNCRVFVLPPANDPGVVDGAVAAAAGNGGGDTSAAPGDVKLAPLQGTAAPPQPALPAADVGLSTVAAAGARSGGGGVVEVSGGMEERLLPGSRSAGESTAGRQEGSGAGLRLSDYPTGPALPLLSQLPGLPRPLPDSPTALPAGWVQLADAFAIFGAYNTQHLALGARSNPGGRMSDGAWEVWHLQADSRRASSGLRLRCLRVLLGIEDGSFAKTPGVMSVIKARAMMFEQRDSATWTVLDGEDVEDRPLYLEVHPGLCSMLVAPRFRDGGL